MSEYEKIFKYSSLLKYYQEIQSKENHEGKYLGEYLNAGNLRHVVYMLCKEKGFSEKDLSEEINHTEKEITELLNKGLVTDDLLNSICNYFNIKKTYEFTRYVQDSNKYKEKSSGNLE